VFDGVVLLFLGFGSVKVLLYIVRVYRSTLRFF
jgi:hypothetical protein